MTESPRSRCARKNTRSAVNYFEFQTSMGGIALIWNEQERLTGIHWIPPQNTFSSPYPNARFAPLPSHLWNLVQQLCNYFCFGEPLALLPWEILADPSWTEFQQRVFKSLLTIPHGETRTYAWLAWKAGKPRATRAVGQVLRKNPLPILIPCHRVVSKTGMGGFMGKKDPQHPALKLKEWLIGIENTYRNPLLPCLLH